MKKFNKLPAIISDIDGVLVRGKNVLARANEVVRFVRRRGLPFLCLTNGGGRLESDKAM
jgi:ribonucleotide monophosphatase NagD (HAD superfamily)